MKNKIHRIVWTLLAWGSLGAQAQIPDTFENLKVLPKDIKKPQLMSIMRKISGDLDMRCHHCHVGEEGKPLSTFDFASDEKARKKKAREMMDMVNKINGQFFAAETDKKIECYTCHHGTNTPQRLETYLADVYSEKGLQETLTTYEQLRERYLIRGSYNFSPWILGLVANRIENRDDKLAIHLLNAKYNPEHKSTFLDMAELHLLAGSDEDARQQLAKGLENNRWGNDQVNRMAYQLKAQAKQEAGLKLLILLTELSPDYANGYDSAGEFFAELGDIPQAIQYYKKALSLDPQSKSAIKALEELAARH